MGLAIISVDSPWLKAGSAGTVVWFESPRKNGRNRHLGGPFLTTWASFGVVVVGTDSVGSGVAERGLGSGSVLLVREDPRRFDRLFPSDCDRSTEKERRRLTPGVWSTFASFTLSTGLDLATSGVELSGVTNRENNARSFPPTGVDIGELGVEWEGVGISSLDGTEGAWPSEEAHEP